MWRIRPTEHKRLSSVSSGALLIWGCLQQRMKQHLLDRRCEEPFPVCSLLFTALTLSKADFQGEALISDLCTGLLVVHLQCVLLSQLTKVQGVVLLGTRCLYIWLQRLTNSLCCGTPAWLLGHQPCSIVSGACLPAVLARQGQGTGVGVSGLGWDRAFLSV